MLMHHDVCCFVHKKASLSLNDPSPAAAATTGPGGLVRDDSTASVSRAQELAPLALDLSADVAALC